MRTHLLVAFLAVASVNLSASAQDEKLKEFKGAIRQLDLKTGAVTLKSLYGPEVKPFSLAAKEVPVTNPLGDKLALADLREDLRVTVKIRGEDEIVALKIDGPYLYGIIKKVDAATRSVALKDVFATKHITVPAAAKILDGGKDGTLEDFKIGGPIQVLYALDRKTILQVQTGKGVHSREPYLRLSRAVGYLVEVEHPKRSVQVLAQSYDHGVIKTYDVSPDVYVRLMYSLKPIDEIGFDRLVKWTKAYYFVDRDTGKIVNIDAELPLMHRRKVVKLDPLARKLTVQEDTQTQVLALDAAVKVWTPRGDGKLVDVTVGRIVNCGLSLDRGRVVLLYLWDR